MFGPWIIVDVKPVRYCFRAAGVLALMLGSVLPCSAKEPAFRELFAKIRPKSPRQAIASFQAHRDFEIELVCCEPMVADPIAIDWGPDGKLWVVEMGDYPQAGDKPNGSGGRIRVLEDTDGDGRYDRSRVFLDRLSYPTGVMAWRKGILVTCAPDIFYAEDTDGNGKADRRVVLFTGFVRGNPQHRVNGLRWGLDNWIYGANGDSGGVIRSLKTGVSVDIHGRDFRIRPGTGQIETATGMAQFGRCRDDWGNWFGGRNLQPIWHCVLADHYLRRNPYLKPPDPCVDLMDPPTCPPVFPISQRMPRFNEFWTLNRFTAASGPAIYRDNLFGPRFSHSCFICEPAYNLVFHGVLQQDGVTFRCRRAADEQTSEFLASRDVWFRPTQVRTGPDGALWVVDMYRLVIEHPDFIPKRWHKQLDFSAGRGLGRIYRVFPKSHRPRNPQRLAGWATVRLVAALDQPNGVQRDMIQQLLVHRNDPQAGPPLRCLAKNSLDAKVRLSALGTLAGLDVATDGLLCAALDDPHPAVRRMAAEISQRRLNFSATVQAAISKRLDDSDPQVRLQIAFSLGQVTDRWAGRALAKLALRDANDPLIMAAVMSSAVEFPGDILASVLKHQALSGPQAALVENLLRLCLESDRNQAMADALKQIAVPGNSGYAAWQFRVIAGWADAVQYTGSSIQQFQDLADPSLKSSIGALAAMVRQAAQVVFDEQAPLDKRVQAVRLLGRGIGRNDPSPRELAQLLVPQVPGQLQQAVVERLAAIQPEDLAKLLLTGWQQYGPELRPQILEILLGRKEWTNALLNAMEADEILPQEIGAVHRNKLILYGSMDVVNRATRLLKETRSMTRAAVIQEYRPLVKQSGGAEHGRAVFRAHCATCHQLESYGTDIGPDLRSLIDRSTEALLVALLDPNRAVAPRYVEYSAQTVSGRAVSGIIMGETGNSLTLVDSQGKKHTLVRADVDQLTSSGRSLMPEGIEKLFQRPTDLRDLITYLQSLDATKSDP